MRIQPALRLLAMGMMAVSGVSAMAGPLFPVLVSDRWGYIDRSGKQVIPVQFERADRFVGDVAPVRMSRWGYVNAGGKVSIPYQFDEAMPFQEGRALVELDHRYGYIGYDGKYVINPQYDRAHSF